MNTFAKSIDLDLEFRGKLANGHGGVLGYGLGSFFLTLQVQ
jgi:hypothetical protein